VRIVYCLFSLFKKKFQLSLLQTERIISYYGRVVEAGKNVQALEDAKAPS
jgi:hypothetical protein